MCMRKQMRHLRLESARVDDLSQRSIRSQRQKIARNIESPGTQRSLVRVLLHVGRLRRNPAEILKHRLRQLLVVGKQLIDGLPVKPPRRSIFPEIRRVVTALPEILVARRTLLPVPALLVRNHDRSQNRQPFNGERDMGQVGDRPVSILEVESVKEFLSLLRSNFLQRLLH